MGVAVPAVRIATILCLSALLLFGGAGPALAHGRGSDATNFRSSILSTPAGEGLRWRILGGDAQLELDNRGPHDVVVLGLHGEPYLRIGPRGAFENRLSPTVPLQRERYAVAGGMDDMDHTATPTDADAAPDWVQVSEEPRWAWHDHRIHWMSPRTPDVDGETVLVPRWEVRVVIRGVPAAVTGELRWIPAPSPLPWVGAGLALALPGLWGLRRPRDDDAHWPSGVRPAAIVLALAALVNVVHLADDAVAPGPPVERAAAAAQTLLYLGLALGGAWRSRRGDYAGVTAMAIGSGALFLGQGLLYLPLLSASQLGHGMPAGLLRFAVGCSLAQLAVVGIVVWRVGRVVQPVQATAEPEAR